MAKTTNSGGGRSPVNVGMRGGAAASGVRPAHVAQMGNAVGNHVMGKGNTGYTGEPARAAMPHSVPLGNERTMTVGVGAGRTCMPCGSQSGVSPTRPLPPGPKTF